MIILGLSGANIVMTYLFLEKDVFILSRAGDKENISFYFFTELKTSHNSYSIHISVFVWKFES